MAPEDEWRIEEAEWAIHSDDLVAAQHILLSYLARHPDDARAREMLADVDAALREQTSRLDDRSRTVGAAGEATRSRPIGVAVIAAIDAALGILFAVLGLLLFLSGSFASLLLIMLGVAMLALARGLWRLRAWARKWSIGLAGLSIFLDSLQLVSPRLTASGDLLQIGARILVNALVIAYLLRVGHPFEITRADPTACEPLDLPARGAP